MNQKRYLNKNNTANKNKYILKKMYAYKSYMQTFFNQTPTKQTQSPSFPWEPEGTAATYWPDWLAVPPPNPSHVVTFPFQSNQPVYCAY